MKKNVTDILDIHTHKLEADSLGKSIVNYPLLADSPLYMPFAGDVKWIGDIIILSAFIPGS